LGKRKVSEPIPEEELTHTSDENSQDDNSQDDSDNSIGKQILFLDPETLLYWRKDLEKDDFIVLESLM